MDSQISELENSLLKEKKLNEELKKKNIELSNKLNEKNILNTNFEKNASLSLNPKTNNEILNLKE